MHSKPGIINTSKKGLSTICNRKSKATPRGVLLSWIGRKKNRWWLIEKYRTSKSYWRNEYEFVKNMLAIKIFIEPWNRDIIRNKSFNRMENGIKKIVIKLMIQVIFCLFNGQIQIKTNSFSFSIVCR